MPPEYSTRSRRSPHDPDTSNSLHRLFGHTATFYAVQNIFDRAGEEVDAGDALYGIDEGGFVMTREEAIDLFHRVIAGIDMLGDEAIDAHNQAIYDERFGDPRITPVDRPIPAPKPERKPRPGDVYLMTNGHLHKIGVSTDVGRRAKQIEKASGMPVRILASKTVPDMLTAELELHERYAQYRREGEWFDLPDDALEALLAEMAGER